MFIKTKTGEICRTLIDGMAGSWLISYDDPKAPFYASKEELEKFERIETPAEYIENMDETRVKSKAEMERLELLSEALKDDLSITDTLHRNAVLKRIARENNTSLRRMQRLYFTYLATGRLVQKKEREPQRILEFDRAINKHYFSAKKHSLMTTYELMILENYTDQDGVIADNVPSWAKFRSYYYRNCADDKRKEISRNGLSNYQRNKRQLYGSAMAYRDSIGSFQMDETTADVYVVSEYDRNQTIGRPNVYLAVDTATNLITGFYAGFDAGQEALMKCIYNTAIDKVEYCKSLGIEITKDVWPNSGLCKEIITDQGSEFKSERLTELCLKYGVEINSNPPFRPEEKSLVERNFGLIQESYKSSLMGAGTVCLDSQERWAHDYRTDAAITLNEYRQILVHSIIAINQRVLDETGHLPCDASNTPSKLYQWYEDKGNTNMLRVDTDELYVLALPRVNVKVSRTGVTVNKIRYIPEVGTELSVGDTLTIAYDSGNTSRVYVINEDKSFTTLFLAPSNSRYRGYDYQDVEVMREAEAYNKNLAEEEELKAKVRMRADIRAIIEKAKLEKKEARV